MLSFRYHSRRKVAIPQPIQFTESPSRPASAWPWLAIYFVLLALAVVSTIATKGLALIVFLPLLAVMPRCFFIVSPNVSRVLVLFGRYRGTVRAEGFYYTNHFTLKHKVSVKAHNFNGERVKVNDLTGNPIEIAAVVVWQVKDSARATFDVEDYGITGTSSRSNRRPPCAPWPACTPTTTDTPT
jgi:regulator of protease activity HflC (stomatin/prohibitin superfamily)